MSMFALPALIALLTKLWIYSIAVKAKKTPKAFLWLLLFFGVHNLSEFLVISKLLNETVSEGLLRSYYVAALFSIAYICIFVMSVAYREVSYRFSFVVLSIAFIMSSVTFLTDWIVAGAVSVGYTVTAIQGEYYDMFLMVVLLGFVWTIYTLLKRYFTTLDLRIQLKCFYTAFSLSPLILMAVIVMVMMQMGYEYTGAILLPFTSTCFLLLIIATEKNSDLIRIRHRLPFSKHRTVEKKILGLYRSFIDQDLGFVDAKTEIEKALIQSALDRSDNNVSLAAHELGIKRSTLYSIFRRLDMEWRTNESDLK